MKFRVSRQAILEAFQVAGSIIPSRPIRPILGSAHIVVRDQVATIMATDQEIGIRYTVPLVEVMAAGEAVISASRATAILRECFTDEVNIEAGPNGKIDIESGQSRFNLLSENPSEFPAVPEFRGDNAFGLNRQKLVSLISKTQFAVAKEKSRYAFNGAKLHIEGDEARMIATDGKRLVMKVETIDNSDGVTAGHIVPARALAVIEKVMDDEDDLVQVTLDASEIMIKTARAQISSRLVEGSFPDHNAVIPKESAIEVQFDREELIRAFRQAALLTSQETRSVKLKLIEGRAILSSQALDAGEATIELELPSYRGEEFEIAFNPEFVVQGLKVMNVEEVTLGLNRPNQPGKLSGEEGFVYLIMPVTVRNG